EPVLCFRGECRQQGIQSFPRILLPSCGREWPRQDEERFEVDCVSRGVSVIRGQDLRSHPEGDRLRKRPRARNTDSRPTDESPHRSELAYDGVRDDGAETDGSPAISFLDRGSRTEFLLRLLGVHNYFCSHGSSVTVWENCRSEEHTSELQSPDHLLC